MDENRNVEWEYLSYLVSMAGLDRSNYPGFSYSLLAEQMYRKEFSWSVVNDDNRVSDALYIRSKFHEYHGGADIIGPASMLEILIVLSYELAFQLSEENDDPRYWFEVLLKTSGLNKYTDECYLNDYVTPNYVDGVLNRIIFRKYDYDGSRGLFPLERPTEDQRSVELWYQLASFAMERSGYA